jgi:hypothetical protein
MRGKSPQLAHTMDQALVAGWALAFGLLLAIAMRRSWFTVPVLIVEATTSSPRPGDVGDEEEQQPETDRAPRSFPWLKAAVAMTAAARLCLLVGWHQ